MIVTRHDLSKRLNKAQVESIMHERRLSDARLELLREHYGYIRTAKGVQVPGKVAPCENPQRYGTDCGKCLRCRSIYTEGALTNDPSS